MRPSLVSPESGRPEPLTYVVNITYREPSYAQRSGTDRPYGCRFIVQAVDEDDAIAQAQEEFEALARKSGVSWVRVIERIDCRHVTEPHEKG